MGNRTIKFKAKRLDNGEWFEGSLLLSEKGKTCIGTMLDSNEENGTPVCFKCREVDPATVCQFTGLKDMKGREIWEHDLVKFHNVTREVIFQNGAFSLEGCALYKTDIGKAEIVGSKFDRKEGEK